MFRYRMNSKPARFGWVVLLVIIGLLLIVLAGQLRPSQPTATSLPVTTQNTVSGAGGTLLQLWDDLRYGAAQLWSSLTGQNQAKQVDIDLGENLGNGQGDDLTVAGSGDDEEDTSTSDVTVEITNPQKPEAFVPTGASPQILIYQTHSHESYEKQDDQDYVETAKWRTVNNNFNVAKVGEELAIQLSTKYGIAVLHDVTDNEYPKLGTSYSRSLKVMQKDMAENKDLKILIDLHRDAYNAGINPSTVTINGKKVARVMIVIGTGEGQTGVGFTEKPDWKKNQQLAVAITDRLNQFDPQLCRKVDIKTGRYNQHVSTGAILIEIGHNKNTLDEALAAVPFVAQAVAEVYNTMMESGALAAVGANVPTATPTLPPTFIPSSTSTLSSSMTPTSSSPPTTSVQAQSTISNMPSSSPSGPTPQIITIEPANTVRPTMPGLGY